MTDLIDLVSGNPGTDRFRDKLSTFWKFTESLARLSQCRRLSVGSIIVDPRMLSVLAIGYNGPPAGIGNGSCRNTVGGCGCVHSEANALIKLRQSGKSVLLVTTSPCEHCSGLIINSSCISAVIYGSMYRDSAGIELIRATGTPCTRISDLVRIIG